LVVCRVALFFVPGGVYLLIILGNKDNGYVTAGDETVLYSAIPQISPASCITKARLKWWRAMLF
jgi:hypothetical protein